MPRRAARVTIGQMLQQERNRWRSLDNTWAGTPDACPECPAYLVRTLDGAHFSCVTGEDHGIYVIQRGQRRRVLVEPAPTPALVSPLTPDGHHRLLAVEGSPDTHLAYCPAGWADQPDTTSCGERALPPGLMPPTGDLCRACVAAEEAARRLAAEGPVGHVAE